MRPFVAPLNGSVRPLSRPQYLGLLIESTLSEGKKMQPNLIGNIIHFQRPNGGVGFGIGMPELLIIAAIIGAIAGKWLSCQSAGV